MTNKSRRISISVTSLLWIIVVASAFCAGLVLPSPTELSKLSPVLIANHDLNSRSTFNEDDFTVEYRPKESIPHFVAINFHQIKGCRTFTPIRQGSYVYTDDLISQNALFTSSIPLDHRVINIKVARTTNQIALHFLDAGDPIAIDLLSDSDPDLRNSKKRIADSVRVFNFNQDQSGEELIVGLLVKEETAAAIVKARKLGELTIGIPKPKSESTILDNN